MKINSFGTATQEEISDLESYIRFELPDDYNKFLLSHNGGSFKNYCVMIPELKEKILINVLLGINIDKRLAIKDWYDEYKDEMLDECLIIGLDVGTGIILLINNDTDRGIYYWDHTYEFECSNDEVNTYYIAKSFTEFVDKLEPFIVEE